ncbi:MAG: hypothetical protein QG675_420 [Patescibacteria group bacterium]|jgi:ribosomal protein S18 acetylase RimI-like enzyme|nr:hypothetical protein [Patescibacteria group bacterium]
MTARKTKIRSFKYQDLDSVVSLSLLAWEPFFTSFKDIVGSDIDKLLHPNWKKMQQKTVEEACKSRKFKVWVAELEGVVVGFFALKLDHKEKLGEVYLLAVHPSYSGKGIGTELNLFALDKMKKAGMKIAKIGTGGDPTHAPARRSYEKAGYVGIPIVHYFKDLTKS